MMRFTFSRSRLLTVSTAFIGALLCVPQGSFAQNRDYDHHDYDQVKRLDAGTRIRVRADEPIDSREGDRRIYRGFVVDDVRGDNGRLVVPAGSPVELKVRVMPDSDLRLDLESINIRGQRYTVDTDPKHVEAQQQGGVIGGIVGALSNGQIGGREVHIPRDSVLTFRLERPLVTGAQDYDRGRDSRDR